MKPIDLTAFVATYLRLLANSRCEQNPHRCQRKNFPQTMSKKNDTTLRHMLDSSPYRSQFGDLDTVQCIVP